MYSLKQATFLAFNHLVSNLEKSGYSPIPNTIGICKHTTRPTKFCLCVDDFGVKYVSQDNGHHLMTSLQKDYVCTADWQDKHFYGLKIDWYHNKGCIEMYMPGYVQEALK